MHNSGGEWSKANPNIWRLAISSPGTVATQLHLQNVFLPSGVTLYVWGSDDAEAQMFLGRGPHSDGEVFSTPVDGDTVVIEVEDSRPAPRSSLVELFSIGGLNHLFQNPTDRFTVSAAGQRAISMRPAIRTGLFRPNPLRALSSVTATAYKPVPLFFLIT